MCILVDATTRQPYRLLNNTPACACYTTCLGEEACGWRKSCPAARKRWQCQRDPLVADTDSNPCPR